MTTAAYQESLSGKRVQCHLCPHRCQIASGKRGRCHARSNEDGVLQALTYGRICSSQIDPIEKKPLYHFHPGAPILSVGTWGCNLHCLFCQNSEISQQEVPNRAVTPESLVAHARQQGSVGIAFTYNEPLIGWEWVRDCATAFREAGLKTVLVTNGFVNPEPLDEILPLIDAMNIDIKAFHENFYRDQCGGHLKPVLETVRRAAKACHVEVTTLLVPELNDAPKELDELAEWIADNCGVDTPAHLSAYTPRYKMRIPATRGEVLQHAREIFKQHLRYVYIGNMRTEDGSNTRCRGCDAIVVRRSGYAVDASGVRTDGTCAACGTHNHFVMN